MAALREDRTVQLVASLIAQGFDARTGTGPNADAVVVRSRLSRGAFRKSIHQEVRRLEITAPAPGYFVIRFAVPSEQSDK